MDFHLRRLFAERLQPKFAQIANGTTWYRDISRLPLKPPQSFKPKNVIKTGFFVFLWIWPKPVRGSQHEENFQKTSLKDKKILRGRHLFYFFKLVSSSSWPFCCFYIMYASFRSVTVKNSKILTPTRRFFVELSTRRQGIQGKEWYMS